jgi:hypothetical protein
MASLLKYTLYNGTHENGIHGVLLIYSLPLVATWLQLKLYMQFFYNGADSIVL